MPRNPNSLIQICDDCGARCQPVGADLRTGEKLPCSSFDPILETIHCGPCVGKRSLENALRHGKGVAYAVERDGEVFIESFGGFKVSNGPVRLHRKSRGGFGRERHLYYFSVPGDDHLWSGQGPGNGMYVRIRRLKEKAS